MHAITPTVSRRELDATVLAAAEQAGYSPLQARILAARLPATYAQDLRAHVTPSLQQLDAPDALPDIAIAARLLADAVMDKDQMVLLLADHDVDGGGACAVLRIVLTDHFGMEPHRIGCVLSHKRKEGFGVSEALLERLIKEFPPPALCVTLDQGSSNESTFAKMREMNYRTICTDHHTIVVPPPSAEACVNPTREDSLFADPFVCGNHVGFLLACATRRELINRGYLPANAPTLAAVLDILAASVVADAVSIARSTNNRAVINYGLRLINSANPRPAWTALRTIMRKEGPFTEQDLAMAVGPRLNAISRMGDAMPIVEFLLAKDTDTAMELAAHADAQNKDRKLAERAMVVEAMALAAPQAAAGRHAIVVHLREGISSIHGIVASRLTEAFGRPAMCLSPKFGSPEQLTGSLRSIPGINILEALSQASRIDPGCTIAHGGHSGAGGCQLNIANVERLANAFNEAVSMQRDLSEVVPVLWSDGVLDRSPDATLLEEIAALGPYGREFDAPMFEADVQVLTAKTMGDGTHMRADLRDANGNRFTAVWFSAVKPGLPPPLVANRRMHILFSLTSNMFRGKSSVEIHIKHATPLH